MAFFERLLNTSIYPPRGICLLWEPELIWLHVVSDAAIALAYFSIPFALAIFVSKRRGYTENAIIHHGRLDLGVLLLAKPYRRSDLATLIGTALAGPVAVAVR